MKNPASVFKALSDPTRFQIARFLAGVTETSCRDLSKKFKLSQPTLSHHFGKLSSAGVILERKNGASRFYRINHNRLKKAGVDLKFIKTYRAKKRASKKI